MTLVQPWRQMLGPCVTVAAALLLRAPVQAQTLLMAQLRDDQPVAGWPDQTRVVHQVEVMAPSTSLRALDNLDRTRRRVENQVDRIHAAYGADAKIYLDFEPGNDDPDTPAPEGWYRRDVQDFAVELLSKYQNVWVFPGVAFDSLVQKDPDAARRVAAAATNGVMFPAYQGVLDVARHEAVTRRRFDRLVAERIKFTPIVWRQYHEWRLPDTGRTDIPQQDFVAGVQLAAEYSDVVAIWGWKPEGWNASGAEEAATVEGMKTQALRNAAIKAPGKAEGSQVPAEGEDLRAENERLTTENSRLRAEHDSMAAMLDQVVTELTQIKASLTESQSLIAGLEDSLEKIQALIESLSPVPDETQQAPPDR